MGVGIDNIARGQSQANALALAESAKQTDGIYAYNINSGLRKWRLSKAALDAGGTGIINLNIVGDSITEGSAGLATTIANYANGFAKKIKTAIATKYGDVGSGFVSNVYPYTAATTYHTFTGAGWLNYGCNGLFYTAGAMKRSATADNTIAWSFNGTGVTVLVRGYSTGGNFTIAIDGGAPVTYSTFNATNIVKPIAITDLADGAHTALLTTTAANIEFLGSYETKGTTGIRVNKVALAGAVIHYLSANGDNLDACIGYFAPKLTILSFLANDFNGQTALASFTTDWQAAITKAKLSGDVLITSIGGIFNATKTIPMSDYKTALYNLAMTNDVAFLDISKRWGNTYAIANAAGYIVDATCHPTYNAHQDIANVILKLLLED